MNVELHVVGDRIVFHKYRVECTVPQPPTEHLKPRELRETLWWKFMERLGRYRIENYGILCDDESELADIEAGLKELGIAYTVRDISPTPEQIAKAKEIDGKIGSRTQALNYILKKVNSHER
ncbi:MAG: hypothetical protein QXZ14_11065 [Candidatus Jordarchaeales archaeon]|nr:hypothetical protein [Candidatus Jordarchaeia archaeon]